MKNLRNYLMGLASLLLFPMILTFCQKEGPNIEEDSAFYLKAGNSIIESVTGSGHILRDDFYAEETYRTFTIQAVKMSDGTVKGNFQIRDHNTASIQGKVLCFTVDGNKASFQVSLDKIRTEVELVDYPFGGFIMVVDNGDDEDIMAPPDQVTLLLQASSEDDCGWKEELANQEGILRDVVEGDITIRQY